MGGGPTGLYLGILMTLSGIETLILEKQPSIDLHSKSLGIHPVSLELMQEIGLAETLIRQGITILQGHVYSDREHIGTLSFSHCPPPYPFVLAIPQFRTEMILQERFSSLSSQGLVRSCEVQKMNAHHDKVSLEVNHYGERKEIHAQWVIGCDGRHSQVRQMADIPFKGKRYPDIYLMGDCPDQTDFDTDAAIYIHREGLVESFPLPDQRRRWVAKREQWEPPTTREELTKHLRLRTGWDLTLQPFDMVSRFGVQHMIASTLHKERLLLAGDAAHIVSPIGGQGMNLGWLNAHHLAQSLKRVLARPKESDYLLREYSVQGKKMARQVGRRAEWNMRMGRKTSLPSLRNIALKAMVNTPLERLMARLFTMRGLNRWPI